MSVSPIRPALSLIGTGLLARLQLAFPATRFQFAWMPPRLSAKEWSKLVSRPPFLGLGWNELGDTSSGRRVFAGQSSWTVYIVVANGDGLGPRYLGDKQAPGLFALVQAAIIALHGFTVLDGSGVPVGSCTVKRASNAFAEAWEAENQAMAAIDVSVTTAMDVTTGLSGAEATPELLNSIAVNWTFADQGDAVQLTSTYPQDAPV